MPENPAISVVIPTYNAAKFLREALDSLVAQTFTDWEAVCVNDGSTDNSLEILQEYAAKDARFRILDGPNGGYGKAMNRGMDAARGKYMAILEPDDYLPPNAYAVLHAAAERHGLDIARGAVCHFWQENGKRTFKYEGDHFAAGMVFCPMDYPRVLRFAPNTWTGLYRMDFLRGNAIRHHESPGAAYQDNGMFCLSTLCARRMMLVSDVVYLYRVDNPASSIHNTEGKPYASMAEFRYIRTELEKHPAVWERGKAAYCDMATGGLLWTYARIGSDMRGEYLERLRQEFGGLAEIGFSGLPAERRVLVESLLESPACFEQCYERAASGGGAAAPCVQRYLGGLVRREVSHEETLLYVAGVPVMVRRRVPVYRRVAGGARMLYCFRDAYRVLGVPVASRIYDCHYTALRLLGVVVRKHVKL